MKHYQKKLAAVLSGMMLLAGTISLLPENRAFPSVSMTVSAAEEDLPWATYLKNSEDWFGTSEATKVADQCIQYQVANEGGWQKGMLTSHTGDWAHSTIDNDAPTSQIRFLMRTYNATKQQKYLDCAMRGVDCLFKMQYSSGGWMQCLNTPGTYHAHITLNDAAYVHVLEIMNEMSKKSGDFTAVSDAYAQKASASLEKGIQCLLDMQISVGGRKTAWCQQHDENTLAPASARAYELPSICTSESAGVITFLYNYGKANPGRKDIVRSVNAAIEWFKKVTLYGIKFVKQGDDKVVVQDANADPLWARFYTLDTEVPMFSDRDSKVYYDVAQISQERRTGYAWYGNWGKNIIKLELLPDDGSTDQPQQPQQPVQKPEYSGTLISKLVVNDTDNGDSWSVVPDFGTGSKIYGDRDYTISGEGNGVGSGGEQIRTACDSKKYSGIAGSEAEYLSGSARASESLAGAAQHKLAEGLCSYADAGVQLERRGIHGLHSRCEAGRDCDARQQFHLAELRELFRGGLPDCCGDNHHDRRNNDRNDHIDRSCYNDHDGCDDHHNSRYARCKETCGRHGLQRHC